MVPECTWYSIAILIWISAIQPSSALSDAEEQNLNAIFTHLSPPDGSTSASSSYDAALFCSTMSNWPEASRFPCMLQVKWSLSPGKPDFGYHRSDRSLPSADGDEPCDLLILVVVWLDCRFPPARSMFVGISMANQQDERYKHYAGHAGHSESGCDQGWAGSAYQREDIRGEFRRPAKANRPLMRTV